MKNLRANNGFTTIEVIIATVLIGIVAVSVFELLIGINGINERARNRAFAVQAAERKIEDLRNTDFYEVTLGSVDFTAELPAELPDASATVTISDADPSARIELKQLDIEISYGTGNSARTLEFSSLIGLPGITP